MTAGSGIEELWGQVYAKASVTHMMSGHAYARALRAYFLTQHALITLLLEISSISSSTRERLAELHGQFLDGSCTEREVQGDPALSETVSALDTIMSVVSANSPTAQLWIQLIELVHLMKLFIRAARTTDWNLHLHCLREMLPFFHAGGRHNYAKAAAFYAQEMETLEQSMDANEYQMFRRNFSIRRGNEFWKGQWPDQVIEQDLQRPLKTQGGLTRGRGITESSLANYIHSFPGCLRVCNKVEEFCGLKATTTDQVRICT